MNFIIVHFLTLLIPTGRAQHELSGNDVEPLVPRVLVDRAAVGRSDDGAVVVQGSAAKVRRFWVRKSFPLQWNLTQEQENSWL